MPTATEHTLERRGPKGGVQATADELARMATRYQKIHPDVDRATAYVAVRNMTPLQYGRMSRGVLTPDEKRARREAAQARNRARLRHERIQTSLEAFCLDQVDRVKVTLRHLCASGDVMDGYVASAAPSRMVDFELLEHRR